VASLLPALAKSTNIDFFMGKNRQSSIFLQENAFLPKNLQIHVHIEAFLLLISHEEYHKKVTILEMTSMYIDHKTHGYIQPLKNQSRTWSALMVTKFFRKNFL